MKRFISSLLAIGMALAPVSSLAEFASPSELFAMLSKVNVPMGFSGELHGNVDNYWFSAWVSGSGKGSGMEATGSIKGTVDIATSNAKARIKFQMRIVDSTAYLYIDSIDGTYEDALWKSVAAVKTKTWIKWAIPAELIQEPTAMDFAMIDEMFQMESRKSGNNTAYTVRFTRGAVQDVLEMLRNMEYDNGTVGMSAVPRTAALNLNFTVDSREKLMQSSGTVTLGNKNMNIRAKGSSWLLSNVNVAAPSNALDLEEWAMSLMGSLGGGMMDRFYMPVTGDTDENWDIPENDWSEHSDYDMRGNPSDNWEDEGDTGVDVIPEGDCRLDMDAVRNGTCGSFKRTPRRLP